MAPKHLNPQQAATEAIPICGRCGHIPSRVATRRLPVWGAGVAVCVLAARRREARAGPAGRETHGPFSMNKDPSVWPRAWVVAAGLVGRSQGANTSRAGEGQSISSRDAPGPPAPSSGPGASPSSPLWTPALPTPPRKQERPPLSWSPRATGQLWVEPVLVSVGSGSRGGRFLPLVRERPHPDTNSGCRSLSGRCVLEPGLSTHTRHPLPQDGCAPPSKRRSVSFPFRSPERTPKERPSEERPSQQSGEGAGCVSTLGTVEPPELNCVARSHTASSRLADSRVRVLNSVLCGNYVTSGTKTRREGG